MTSHFRLTAVPPMRDLLGRFAKAETAFIGIRRDEMSDEGKRFIGYAEQEAPGGPGRTVAKQVGYRTFLRGDAAGFEAWPGKIGAWHIAGTGIYGPRGQLIRPLGPGYPLRFEIDGEVLFRMWVRGIKKNPFFSRAYRRWLPGAKSALRRMGLRWVRELKGAGAETKEVTLY